MFRLDPLSVLQVEFGSCALASWVQVVPSLDSPLLKLFRDI